MQIIRRIFSLGSIDYYDQNAVEYYEGTVNLDMGAIMEEFAQLLPENAEVLDLGCGSGRDIIQLEEYGFSVTGLDGSIEMCKLAEILTDREILHLSYEDMDFLEVFHGVWSCASLVHISYNKISKVLGKIMTALKPGGILYFSVRHGCGSCWDNGREYFDYTEETLNTLIQHIPGCKVCKVWESQDILGKEGRMPWWNVLIQKEED